MNGQTRMRRHVAAVPVRSSVPVYLLLMVRRTQRIFSDGDREAMLAAVKACRTACVAVCTKAPIYSAEYVAAGKLMGALDDMAETLTGDRTHFHTKSHSTHGGARS